MDFEVRWLPFQLDPAASEKASSRMEAVADADSFVVLKIEAPLEGTSQCGFEPRPRGFDGRFL